MVNIPAPPPLAQTASAKEEISSQDFDQLQQQLQDIKEQVTEEAFSWLLHSVPSLVWFVVSSSRTFSGNEYIDHFYHEPLARETGLPLSVLST